jgi:ADP-ribose pyrophosphatase YjhB (NUDIX family)
VLCLRPRDYDVTQYERPSVTVDVVIFSVVEGELKVLLIRRRNWPFEGMWAIPGGFVEIDEPLEDAAARELYEETGVKGVAHLGQAMDAELGRNSAACVAIVALCPIS